MNNKAEKQRRGIVQISEVANALIDPVLAKRAGINTMLLGSWDEIAGSQFAECTRPERIAWPRRAAEMAGEGGGYQPGVLTIACEGARALFLSHQQGEIIQRINGFFGFPAIRQIRIVQKPVTQHIKGRKRLRPLSAGEKAHIEELTSEIESEPLKAAVERLGKAFYGSRKR